MVQKQVSRRLARWVGADDIAQSVFRAFFRRAHHGFDHPGLLWHLLVRIAMHKLLRQAEFLVAHRRAVSAELHGAARELSPEAVAHDPAPVEPATAAEELESLLATADAVEAQIVQLSPQGYSTTQIADRRLELDRAAGAQIPRQLKRPAPPTGITLP